MERKFEWKELSATQALLHGPGGETIAEIEVNYRKEDMSDLAWRVTSDKHERLNLEEYNTAIPLRDMELRVMVLLGNEIARERDRLAQMQRTMDRNLSAILEMMWEQATVRSGKDIRMLRRAGAGEAV